CLDTLMHSAPESRHHWGENLASYGIMGGTGREPNGSPAEVVALWESELGCYTFGPFASGTNETCSADCAKYGGCGHYTQLVWRATRRFGCGSADCMQGDWRKTYWVCNYDPPGNLRGQFPY
ncbi:MAG TPA: CAP domain-containing protein, partial [Polyangiales bacterium]